VSISRVKSLDGFFDEVGVLIADVLELSGWDSDVERFADDAREASLALARSRKDWRLIFFSSAPRMRTH